MESVAPVEAAVEVEAPAELPEEVCPATLPPVDDVEAEETPGVEVPLGVLPCAAAARCACIEDDGWN